MKLDVENRCNLAVAKMNELFDSVDLLNHAVKEFSDNVTGGRSVVSGIGLTSSTSMITRSNDELFDYFDTVLSTTYLELVFQAQFNIFEATLFDMLSIYIKSDLTLLNSDRELTTGMVLNAGSYEKLITELIHSELTKVAYGSVQKWMKQVNKYLKYNIILDSDLAILAEMKATRNLLVHADGVCNKIYIEASGEQSRFKMGDRVTVKYSYIYQTHLLLSGVLERSSKVIASKG